MNQSLIFFSLMLLLVACNSGNDAAKTASTESSKIEKNDAFLIEAVPGSNYQHALKKGSDGALLEEGITDAKGLKSGVWVMYQGEGGYPAKIASYVKGVYNGPYFEFDSFGRMALRATYKNNKLHGTVVKFLNGELAQESNYKDGILDGVYKEYNRQGGIQKEINYKNGKLDGPFRYYDENGKVNLQYMYKDGKQQ